MRKNKVWFITGLLATLGFIALTLMVMTKSTLLVNFDATIQHITTPMITTPTTTIFSSIAFFGSPMINILLIFIVAGGLWLSHERLTACWVICVQLGGSALAYVIKNVVHRARPQFQVIKDTGFSFPSGHTFTTAILVLTILFVLIPYVKDAEIQLIITLLSLIWFGLVAFSRIYLRAHWPSDVLGSTLLSLSWWEISRLLYFYFLKLQTHFPKLKMKGVN